MFFREYLVKNISFLIWRILAKFHNQTVFTSQVIQENASLVLRWGIWFYHENLSWISEEQAFEVK